jgi:hypothetical protein
MKGLSAALKTHVSHAVLKDEGLGRGFESRRARCHI